MLPEAETGRPRGRFDLTFHRVGERTRIGRQYVAYPCHLTRPFNLDPALPALTTLYQQSASGGLYGDDQIDYRLNLAAASAVHATTQAATVVHHARGGSAKQVVAIDLDERSFLAFVPDPLVLFPGAALETSTEVSIAPSAVLMLSDSFACHDPAAGGGMFEQYASDVSVRDRTNRLLLRERFSIRGADLAGEASPVGHWRLAANHFLLGDPARLPSQSEIAAVCAKPDALAGVSPAPNDAGWIIRVLAASAIADKAVADGLFVLAVRSALGSAPSLRRK